MKLSGSSMFIIVIVSIIFISIIGYNLGTGQSDVATPDSSTETLVDSLIPVDEISHGHGLAVAIDDPNKLYIASHYGLLTLINDQQLYRIGQSQDDLMGFSPHPLDSRILYSSGHPQFGGNLGIQISVDGGVSWQKLTDGVNGPVDFHTMTVSPANPEIMYGWYQNQLQQSQDGAESWQVVDTNITGIISLTAHPQDENIIYAATDQGLYASTDQGIKWASTSPELEGGAVIALSINPDNPLEILTYSERLNSAISYDAGVNWKKIDESFGGDIPLYFAYNNQDSRTIYALTRNNYLYKTSDSTKNWQKVL